MSTWMNRGIYSTASGMAACQQSLDVIANNLANLNTNGFKRDQIAFQEALDQTLVSGSGGSLGQLGSGPVAIGRSTVFEPGPQIETGNDLDVAINGEQGLFAIRTPWGVRYTRDGSFSLDSTGQMVTKQGYPVLGEDLRPIDLPDGKVQIGMDGAIAVDGKPAGQLGIFDGQFLKEGQGLFASSGAKPLAEPSVTPGAIEGSNVNAIEAMVSMIALNRTYEMAQKSISQQDELTQRLISSIADR